MTRLPLSDANLVWLDEMYEKFQADPEAMDLPWRRFFEGVELGSSFLRPRPASDDLRIYNLIQAYRSYGHLKALFNPLHPLSSEKIRELDIKNLGFKAEELLQSFPTCGFIEEQRATLQQIIDALEKTYCGTIGVEYRGLGQIDLERWLEKRIEPYFPMQISREEKLDILHNLNRAELFESFLHTKYVGQKRFSLEGCETLIPMLAALLRMGAQLDVSEAVIGMSHRGRLNVLANILGKSYASIFSEFEDHYTPDLFEGTGDVKYHKGFSGTIEFASGKKIDIFLAANPSHLESVDPVVEGMVRAHQEQVHESRRILPLLIHGDAAVSGQGVVYETLQLCRLNGYKTGGTIHIVINNQIGFTALPQETRSTLYCTDIAKAFGAPVFHVNAEDPEGCVAVAKMAIEMRQKFGCDLFIDLNGYRKYGHNESDEPAFTQPLEVEQIRKKEPIRALYLQQLIGEGILDQLQAENIEEQFKTHLHDALGQVQSKSEPLKSAPPQLFIPPVATAVPRAVLIDLAKRSCAIAPELHIHPKIKRLAEERLKMVEAEPHLPSIDWAMSEQLAYASLLTEGIPIRLAGQDSRRGTFSQRHAVWVDQQSATSYFPLSHLGEKSAPFDIYNSPLSEFAALGFEFGYSLFDPESLVIWEAQFGDFANGAQIVIDQYIATCEQKWGSRTSLTLLLPHGFEGQGPEHSSARIERFLQLCGDDNLRIANATTPAQFFHLLRRQGLCRQKKPLILFTPKGLLRLPACISPLNALSHGTFVPVLDDPAPSSEIKLLLLCSGRIFYDLLAQRAKGQRQDIAILRLEQIYPFPTEELRALLRKYAGAQKILWVQEEHRNMGPWEFVRPLLEALSPVTYAGRAPSASPAAGSYGLHKRQHEQLIRAIFEEHT